MFSAVGVAMLFAGAVRAATYSISDTIIGNDFNNEFTYEAISDPTHGRVNYVSKSTAQSQNLTFANSNTFILRSDFKKQLSSSGPGRDSVRLQSNKQYSKHVVVVDLRHMPRGCGTWPAIWEVGTNWPNNGEIDIVEGRNDVSPNQATLHTSSGCTMPSSRDQSGSSVGNDCNVATTNNNGCGVKVNKGNSYGPGFDSAGGGWYAMERSGSYIRVYFWSRSDGSVPSEVKNGSGNIDTVNWGQPVAWFPIGSSCSSSHFGPMNIIINLTFCGDFAGTKFSGDGCGSSCDDFVNNNPSAFKDAYFNFAAMRIYT